MEVLAGLIVLAVVMPFAGSARITPLARGREIVLAFFMVAWVSSAHALDRAGAIEVAKRQVRNQCGPATFCTFDARLENNRWHVRVDFAKSDSPDEKPRADRKPAIFVIDQSGRIVGRMEGK